MNNRSKIYCAKCYQYDPATQVMTSNSATNIIGMQNTLQIQFAYAGTTFYTQYNFPSTTTAANFYIHVPPPETPEQRIAREEREIQHRKKVEVAASRAEELLFMCIGEQRKKQYIEFKYFDVEVNGKVYRIHRGRSMNIDLLENGERKSRFCIQPLEHVPDPDTMLAQFLMLTTDEQRFLHVANESRVNPEVAIAPPYPEDVIPDVDDEEQAFAAQVELAA